MVFIIRHYLRVIQPPSAYQDLHFSPAGQLYTYPSRQTLHGFLHHCDICSAGYLMAVKRCSAAAVSQRSPSILLYGEEAEQPVVASGSQGRLRLNAGTWEAGAKVYVDRADESMRPDFGVTSIWILGIRLYHCNWRRNRPRKKTTNWVLSTSTIQLSGHGQIPKPN